MLRAITDAKGDFGNPLGVAEADLVDPADRQNVSTKLGCSETLFVKWHPAAWVKIARRVVDDGIRRID